MLTCNVKMMITSWFLQCCTFQSPLLHLGSALCLCWYYVCPEFSKILLSIVGIQLCMQFLSYLFPLLGVFGVVVTGGMGSIGLDSDLVCCCYEKALDYAYYILQ